MSAIKFTEPAAICTEPKVSHPVLYGATDKIIREPLGHGEICKSFAIVLTDSGSCTDPQVPIAGYQNTNDHVTCQSLRRVIIRETFAIVPADPAAGSTKPQVAQMINRTARNRRYREALLRSVAGKKR